MTGSPWRYWMLFVSVIAASVVCWAAILWSIESGNRKMQHNQELQIVALNGIRDLAQKSDRNNNTTWRAVDQAQRSYEAGRKARAQLVRMVTEEHRMNVNLTVMVRTQLQREAREIRNQQWMRAHIARLEKRRR